MFLKANSAYWSVHLVSSNFFLCVCVFMLHSENGPQITYVRDFKAKVHYFRFWCQVGSKSAISNLVIDFYTSSLYM